jgi:hypothetical protein
MERKVTLSAKVNANAGRAALNISALKVEQTKEDD